MKRLIVALVTVLSLLTVTACGNSNKEKEETASSDVPESITVICNSDEQELFEYIAEKYKEEYDVEVKIINQAYDSTHEKITTTWTGGGEGDVCYVDTPWAAEFGSLGITIGLNDYMSQEYQDGFVDSALDQMYYDEQVQAIPFANNGKWMFYNKAALAEAGYDAPPTTWDELKEMSETLIEKGICKYGIAWGASQAEGLMCDLTTMIYGFGGSWQNEDGTFAFNSQESAAALQFIYDSMQDGWADPASITYSDRDCVDPFLAGDTAFVMNWSYIYEYGNDPANSKVAGDVDICLMPGTGQAVSSSVTGGGGLGVMSTSKYPEYAFEFIEMVTSSEIQQYALETYSSLPTIKSLYEDEELLAANEALGKFYPQYETAHYRPLLVKYSEWSNTVQPLFSGALAGDMTVTEALEQAESASAPFVE